MGPPAPAHANANFRFSDPASSGMKGTIGDAANYSCVSDATLACCLPTIGLPRICAAAGSTCVALAPNTSANGTIGEARQYLCGGGLGVGCCLPK